MLNSQGGPHCPCDETVVGMPSPEITRARELRRDMSGTERRVSYRLRRRSVGGYKFRRQVPIGPYFADFACLAARLVVEIDRDFHEDPDRDLRKTVCLETHGWQVLRVYASETDRGRDDVVERVVAALQHQLK